MAKDVVWFALALLVAANVRRFGRLITLVVLGHLTIASLLAVLIVTGRTGSIFPSLPAFVAEAVPGIDIPPGSRLLFWLGGALIPTFMLGWLWLRAHRSQYRLRSFGPSDFEALTAFADAVFTRPKVPPEEIAQRVDRYWAGFRTRDHRRLKIALRVVNLWPLATLRPPLVLMDRERRRAFIEKRMIADLADRRVLSFARRMIQAAFRSATQFTHAGYYGDPRTHEVTGYDQFIDRPGAREAIEAVRRDRVPLRTIPPRELDVAVVEADVVIAGSGAAGAVMAHELVGQGHDVLIVERGAHVDPSEFSDDELTMYSKLYSDGALQLARDVAFQVLQGRCVGGSTVVNNGVCLDLPQEVLDRWNGSLGAGLPRSLAPSFAAVRQLIGAQSLAAIEAKSPFGSVVSEGARLVAHGVDELGIGQSPARFGGIEANINACLGCGNCNIGCPYGQKLSMLDHVLPATQQAAERGPGPGRLRILSECEAVRIRRDGPRASGLKCRVLGAEPRDIEVRARKALVVAGGAIHSSRLLQDSGIAKGRAGRGLCANISTYMTGDFEEQVRSHRGLQMTHVLAAPVEQGYAIETWFNPVMTQSMLMPGWLGQHEANMARYDHMTCAGVVVGSQPGDSSVLSKRSPKRWLSGADYDFSPHPDDLAKVIAGMRRAGEVLFAAGAKRVMAPTFRYREYHRPEELEELELLRDDTDVSLNTAHPQGGNAISADPSRGVVDPAFRVHGLDNLYVCDASVFPTGVTVNPQLTVMALAHHAATHPQGLGGLGG